MEPRQPKQLSVNLVKLIVSGCDEWKQGKVGFNCVIGCEGVGKLAPSLSVTST